MRWRRSRLAKLQTGVDEECGDAQPYDANQGQDGEQLRKSMQDRRAEGETAADMGEIGADPAGGAGAADCVASRAAALHEQSQSVAFSRRLRSRRGRGCLLEPFAVSRLGHRHDVESHQRMRAAAIFRALPTAHASHSCSGVQRAAASESCGGRGSLWSTTGLLVSPGAPWHGAHCEMGPTGRNTIEARPCKEEGGDPERGQYGD